MRRFSETPIPRRAINLIKNAILSLDWHIQVVKEVLEEQNNKVTPDQEARIKFATQCMKSPNGADSYRTLSEAVLEDTIIGGYGCIEPRLTPDFKKPFKLWAVDGPYSEDTDVLTKRGWINWSQVKKTDVFATRNKRGRLVWQKCQGLIKQYYDGPMVHFKGNNVDLLVTPNHRMYGRKVWRKKNKKFQTGKLIHAPASSIATMEGCDYGGSVRPFRIPLTAKWKGEIPTEKKVIHRKIWHGGHRRWEEMHYEVDWKDWVAFVGIYLAEGSSGGSFAKAGIEKFSKRDKRLHYVQAIAAVADLAFRPKSGSHQIKICQSKKSQYYEDIRQLLGRLPWEFHEDKSGGFRTGNVALWEEFSSLGCKYTKYIPEEIKNLPPDLLRVLVEWMVKGDGSKMGEDAFYYVTASKKLADDFQEVMLKIGQSASISVRQDSPKNPIAGAKKMPKGYAPHYYLRSKKREFAGVGKDSAETIRYRGNVYCATVPNGNLYVRRNGYPVWCGNSTIRIYADWSESTPEKPHYAQLTGLKGERGIISFRDDELIYIRTNVRSSTPFGLGNLEVAFNSVNAFLGVQDMSARAASDQIHKTFLWWQKNMSPQQLQQVRRYVRNEYEGEGQLSLMANIDKPETVEVTPVTEEDLLLNWQQLLIRIIAQAFDLSAMAIGIENDVNRATAQVLDDKDFRSAVVPKAVIYAEAITRMLLWKILGWKDLEFVYSGLDDPDEQIQMQIYETQIQNDILVPDEVRAEMDLPPLPGGWGKVTQGMYRIMMMAARGMGENRNRPPTGGPPQPGGMPGQQPGAVPPDLQGLDPSEIEEYRQAGLLPPAPPQQQQQPGAQTGDASQSQAQSGVLDQLTDQIEELMDRFDKESKKRRVKTGGFGKLKKEQVKRFRNREHKQTREEADARDIEKRLQYALTRRPSKRKQGNQFTGRYPGGF